MNWAKNNVKLHRAISLCGVGATEEQIKAKYIELGGLVVEGGIEDEGTPFETPMGTTNQQEGIFLSKETIQVPVPKGEPEVTPKKRASKKTVTK